MLARIRVGDQRFIAAASGPPRGSQPCCAGTPGVLRDLDFDRRLRNRSYLSAQGTARLPDSVQLADPCDQGSCTAFVQVSIRTRKRPLGFRVHYYDTKLRRARRARLRPCQAHRGP
jgi:hypothetical protein